nr:hypothetical protein [Tanacetum cinerariifolium]
LIPTTPPISVRPYKHPPSQKDAVELMVKELLDSGVIRNNQSPFSSPIVMEHVHHLRKVLTVMKTHSLFAKLSKCTFATNSVEYLGHIISDKGVSSDISKVQAMQSWPVP